MIQGFDISSYQLDFCIILIQARDGKEKYNFYAHICDVIPVRILTVSY